MWRRRILFSATLLGSASALSLSCSSGTPVDQNFGTDAGASFEAPLDGSGGAGSGDAAAGTGGSGGALGTGGGSGGSTAAGGAGGDTDAGIGGTGGTASLENQNQHSNRLQREGAA